VLRALVERARDGDEEAFASLARAAGDRLLAIAYRILRDLGLAEDGARARGTGTRDVMQGASFGACCSHWSPDGSAIVAPATATATGDDQIVLVVLPVDGSGIRQVTTVPAYYTSISWGAASR
jgi:hypothetical protein